MKIAIMSDSHEHWRNLGEAIETANARACSDLLFAGDLIAPPDRCFGKICWTGAFCVGK